MTVYSLNPSIGKCWKMLRKRNCLIAYSYSNIITSFALVVLLPVLCWQKSSFFDSSELLCNRLLAACHQWPSMAQPHKDAATSIRQNRRGNFCLLRPQRLISAFSTCTWDLALGLVLCSGSKVPLEGICHPCWEFTSRDKKLQLPRGLNPSYKRWASEIIDCSCSWKSADWISDEYSIWILNASEATSQNVMYVNCNVLQFKMDHRKHDESIFFHWCGKKIISPND